MIQGWKGKEAQSIFETGGAKGVAPDVTSRARRKLAQLDAAAEVDDMLVPPSNRLHKVGGAWSVSVNGQWRITFTWEENDAGPDDVWFGDYH